MLDVTKIITQFYDPNSELFRILTTHSEQVKNKALDIVSQHKEFAVDIEFIAEAAMLHDIGIINCFAPSIYCFGKHKYIEHGYLGAEMLRKEGLEKHALVCERHTGTGLKAEVLAELNVNLPLRDMLPVTLEEEIICYADKFYSKSNLAETKTIEQITLELSRYGDKNVEVFLSWHSKFA